MRQLAINTVMVVAMSASVDAGGPLVYTHLGPLTWDRSRPVAYRVDAGPLKPPSGSVPGIDNPEARQMVAAAFATWGAVPGIQLTFAPPQSLPEDVTTPAAFLDLDTDTGSGSWIVFDQEGHIIDGLYGQGQSNFILGFAAPIRVGNRIGRFISLMNGRLAGSRAQFQPTLVHEFGHALGLDHSQIQSALANDGDPTNDEAVPVMFPTSTDSESLPTPPERVLHGDDVAWASWIYRRSSTDFYRRFGRLRGLLRREDDGRPVLGANVVAIDQSSLQSRRFSGVSDYLKGGTGRFSIPLPPGRYTLLVEPIREGFVEGSSVGPYAETSSDVSFTTRVVPTRFDQVYQVNAGQLSDVVLRVRIQP